MKTSSYYGAVNEAKRQVAAGNIDAGLQNLMAADAAATKMAAEGRTQVAELQRKGRTPEARRVADAVNAVIKTNKRVRRVLSNFGAGGVPNGAGLFARIPLTMKDAVTMSGGRVVEAGSEWVAIPAAAATEVSAVSPDIPYLKYRVHGFVADAQPVGRDILVTQDLKAKGFPNILIGEGEIGIQSYSGAAALLGGLRDNPEITSPNTVEAKFRSFTNAQAAEADASAGYGFAASLVVEITDDQVYGKINSLEARRNTAGGLLSSMAAPGAGWVERIPMLVKNAGNIDPAGSPQASLGYERTSATSVTPTNAIAGVTQSSVLLESEDIPYSSSRVVGLENEYLLSGVSTFNHMILVEDFKVKGGSSLLAQEGKIPAWNFLGDAAEYSQIGGIGADSEDTRAGGGWGLHKRPALRGYPELSTTNRIQLTASAALLDDSDGSLDASNGPQSAANVLSAYQAWALVNRMRDDVFGAPQAAINAILSTLG